MTTSYPTPPAAYATHSAHRDIATATAKAAGGAQALIRTLEQLRDLTLAEGRIGEAAHHTATQALALLKVCEDLLDAQAKTSLTAAMEIQR